ncbi:MAG: hypothetical protein B6D36_05255 [Planctomycetes bacterium UTPLA1]|nr:MAG: hypothetical protein B6D36_05255 [Planctomycetes bacterium UTPLA1]
MGWWFLQLCRIRVSEWVESIGWGGNSQEMRAELRLTAAARRIVLFGDGTTIASDICIDHFCLLAAKHVRGIVVGGGGWATLLGRPGLPLIFGAWCPILPGSASGG